MSVLTDCMLEMCFWFRIRLTKVRRLTVKSEINETVGRVFSEVKTVAHIFTLYFKDRGFQVTKDGSETTWFTEQDAVAEENCTVLILSLQLLCLLLSCFFTTFSTLLLRDRHVHKRLRSVGYKNLISPRFI